MRNIISLLFAMFVATGCANDLQRTVELRKGNAVFSLEQPDTTSNQASARGAYAFTSVDGKDAGAGHEVVISPGLHAFILMKVGSGKPESLTFHLNIRQRHVYVYRLSGDLEVYQAGTGDYRQSAPVEVLRMKNGEMVNEAAQLNARRQAEKAAVMAKRNEELALQAAARDKIEMPKKRKIGAQLCHKSEGRTYVGYVEALAEQKVKIRVVRASIDPNPEIFLDRSVPVPDFNEQTIWDFPLAWYLCGAN